MSFNKKHYLIRHIASGKYPEMITRNSRWSNSREIYLSDIPVKYPTKNVAYDAFRYMHLNELDYEIVDFQ